MRSLNSFIESTWLQTYKSTDQAWLSDALNWETSTLVASDWSLVSFIFNHLLLINTWQLMQFLKLHT